MGSTTSIEKGRLNIVDTLPANTDFEPLSEEGFVWILAYQVESIPGCINSDYPVWIKMSIFQLSGLPVYNQEGLVSLDTALDPNGPLVAFYYSSTTPTTSITEQAFYSVASNAGVLSIVTTGVLPPPAKISQDLYVQHSTLAPQVPQVSTSDLLAEIIQRQTNPLDTRKLADNVTITVGSTKYNKNCKCKRKCSHKK